MSYLMFVKVDVLVNSSVSLVTEERKFGCGNVTYEAEFNYLCFGNKKIEGYINDSNEFVFEQYTNLTTELVAHGIDESDILCCDQSIQVDLDESIPF